MRPGHWSPGGSRARNTAGSATPYAEEPATVFDRPGTGVTQPVRRESPPATVPQEVPVRQLPLSPGLQGGWQTGLLAQDRLGRVLAQPGHRGHRQERHRLQARAPLVCGLPSRGDVPDPVHPATAHVGIDLGIATFAAFSDGALHPPLNAYRTYTRPRKPACSARLAGMVKYSQNWKKQQQRMAKLDIRIANCRHDFLHKLRPTPAKTTR